MREATNALLTAFEELNWFHSVGKPIADEDIVNVTRWLDASAFLQAGFFEILSYQEGGHMENAIIGSARGMKKRWKDGVAELRPLARRIVQEKMRPARESREWPILVEMLADYDISYALLEKEFELQPGFFGIKAHWYLQGHLPCGVTAEGDLIVY